MEEEFTIQFHHAECHVSTSDPFRTTESQNRSARYGVSGIPHVVVDGKINEIGADVCPNQAGTYRNDINQRLSETGGVSPIKITGNMSVNGNLVTVSATFEQVDPGTFNAHQATLFLYEDDLTWCCGFGGVDHWNTVVRMVRTSPVSLTGVGQQVTVNQVWDLTTAIGVPCNPANLHPAAVFEEVAGQKSVLQASDLQPVDYAWDIPVEVASIPAGNGTATFEGTLTNIGDAADVLSLTLDAGFGDWAADFQVAGDPTWYTSHNLALSPGQSKGITLRVQTNGVKAKRVGALSVQSTNTGRVKPESARVFNASPAILLVDDDEGQVYEGDFTAALTSLGYLYEVVEGAGLAGMLGFDAMIWQTGYRTGSVLTGDDETAIKAFMDQGGAFFLSSMDYLSSQSGPTAFLTNYLGVSAWVNNTKCTTATGVSGDPITNGMVQALTWPQASANRVDKLTPVAGATTIFTSEIGPNNPAAIRFQTTNGSRSVFCTIAEDAFSTVAPDPNNNETFIERVLQWILTPSADVIGSEQLASLSRFTGASPNPFAPATQLQFVVSPRAAKSTVELSIVDASGRRVRTLRSGGYEAGLHELSWDGTDDLGHVTPAGLYFARLKSEDGEASFKLTRIR